MLKGLNAIGGKAAAKMIRLQDDFGNWVHEVIFNQEDEDYDIDISRYEVFAKLFAVGSWEMSRCTKELEIINC